MMRRPLWPVFLRSSAHSGIWRDTLPGVLLCCSACQAHRGPPRLGSYSVDRHARHLNVHPGWVLLCSSVCQVFDGPASLLFSCPMLACGEREAMVTAPPPVHDSALLSWLPGCPPQAFPTTTSSLPSPQSISLQSRAALSLGLLHNL